MGFSKFEFQPTETEGASEGALCLDCWCRTHVNLGAAFERLYFRQHFNYKWCIKIDQCKVKHLLQVPCSPI